MSDLESIRAVTLHELSHALGLPCPGDRALTLRQPWASLVMAGLKPVENRTWPVPSTLPQWWRCPYCSRRSRGAIKGRCPAGGFCGPAQADGLFPFRLWVHAGARHDGNEHRRALIRASTSVKGDDEPGNTMEWIRGWWGNRDPQGGYGALAGSVTVTGCHHADECFWDGPYLDSEYPEASHGCSPWAEPNRYHWTLADPQPLDEPIPMRGRQGLWRITEADLGLDEGVGA